MMEVQRLRNLTTGILHTEISHVYKDLEYITGQKGLMTHMLPNVMRSIEPWLKEQLKEERFWDGKFDKSHIGDFNLQPMTDTEIKKTVVRYQDLPSPLENKSVAIVSV